MYVFSELVLSAYTIFDYHPAIFESYSNLREDLYFFPTTFHFRILSYTLWVESPVHGVQTTLRFSSFHALSCDPSHISHSYPVPSLPRLQLFSFFCSPSPFPLTLCWSSFPPRLQLSFLCFTVSPTPCSSSFFTRLLLFCFVFSLSYIVLTIPSLVDSSSSFSSVLSALFYQLFLSFMCFSHFLLPAVVPSLHCPCFAHVTSLF